MDRARVDDLLRDVKNRVRALPDVNTSAKLAVLVRRVETAVTVGADLTRVTTDLVNAAGAALEDDPWVQFHRAAVDLQAAANPATTVDYVRNAASDVR